MTDYSGDIAGNVTVRGPSLVINELTSLTVDTVDITHDSNFHQILESNVVISSVGASLNGDMRTRMFHHQVASIGPATRQSIDNHT